MDDEIKPVIWMGDSLKQVKSFPLEVRRDIGAALYDAQKGSKSPAAKPLKSLGGGIFEIVSRFETNAFRTIYVVQIGEQVYVLHAFQKKSKTGIKTPKKDINLIKSRYLQAIEMGKEENQ